MLDLRPAIGLEVHAQLQTETKLFCRCRARFGDEPNTNVCPVCLGLPGSLPVLNGEAVRMALRLGVALGSAMPGRSEFARKNYFYPDNPRNYQISMYDKPLCLGGSLYIEVGGSERSIGIERIHLEDDAGKLVHHHGGYTLVDFNRAGVPLAEIVTRPEIRTPREAAALMKTLRQVVRYLGICDGNLEEGSMRCDVNVSMSPAGSDQLGTRTEIKNLNSFKAVEAGIRAEIDRQQAVLESGGSIEQATYLWHAGSGELRKMRSKEEAHDYRYFTEPDLRPLSPAAIMAGLDPDLPEMPREKRVRFEKEYGLSSYDSGVLTAEKSVAEYFERVVEAAGDPKTCCNWVMREVLGGMKGVGTATGDFPVSAERLAELILLVRSGRVSGSAGSEVFGEMARSSAGAEEALDRLGLEQESGTDVIGGIVDEVLKESPEEVRRYRDGDRRLFGWFVGEVMARSGRKANPGIVNRMLRERLG